MKRARTQWVARYFERTRGPLLELTRHFFLGLLRSESFAGDDTFTTWLVQILAFFVAASWMLPTQLFRRYVNLHSMPEPGPYLRAYSADTLWTILLMSLLMAFVTLIEWPGLFPSRRDHLVLSPLPLTRTQIFGGKVFALTLFFSLFLFAITFFSSVCLPFVSAGRWEHRGIGIRVMALLLASVMSGYFTFLALVGLQGVLSLLIPMRSFAAISFSIQVFLLLTVLCSFPVLPYFPASDFATSHSLWLTYLPPAWFWGWGEQVLGDRSGFVADLAARARTGVLLAFMLAAVTYLVTYLRLTRLASEMPRSTSASRWNVAEWIASLFPRPQAKAVSAFIVQTLLRARQQKLVFLLVAGAGIALIVENSVYLGLHAVLRSQHDRQAIQTAVIALPLTLSFFAMVGLRRVFRMPAELEANWIFRFLEDPCHIENQLSATFGTFLVLAGLVPLGLGTPLEFFTFGALAIQIVTVEILMTLAFAEYLMRGWSAIPFTFAQRDARHIIHSVLSHFIELSIYSFSGAGWVYLSLKSPKSLLALVALSSGIWIGLRYYRRRESRTALLEFSTPTHGGLDVLQLNPE